MGAMSSLRQELDMDLREWVQEACAGPIIDGSGESSNLEVGPTGNHLLFPFEESAVSPRAFCRASYLTWFYEQTDAIQDFTDSLGLKCAYLFSQIVFVHRVDL